MQNFQVQLWLSFSSLTCTTRVPPISLRMLNIIGGKGRLWSFWLYCSMHKTKDILEVQLLMLTICVVIPFVPMLRTFIAVLNLKRDMPIVLNIIWPYTTLLLCILYVLYILFYIIAVHTQLCIWWRVCEWRHDGKLNFPVGNTKCQYYKIVSVVQKLQLKFSLPASFYRKQLQT